MEDIASLKMDGLSLDELSQMTYVSDDALATLQEWGDDYAPSFLEYQNLRDVGIADEEAYAIADALAQQNDGLFRYKTLDERPGEWPEYGSFGLTPEEFELARKTFGAELPSHDELVGLLEHRGTDPLVHPYQKCTDWHIRKAKAGARSETHYEMPGAVADSDANMKTEDAVAQSDAYVPKLPAGNTVEATPLTESERATIRKTQADSSFTGPAIDAVKAGISRMRNASAKTWRRGMRYAAIGGLLAATAFMPSSEREYDMGTAAVEPPAGVETTIEDDIVIPEIDVMPFAGDQKEIGSVPPTAGPTEEEVQDTETGIDLPSIEDQIQEQFSRQFSTDPLDLVNQQVDRQMAQIDRQYQSEQAFDRIMGGIFSVGEWAFGSGNELVKDVGSWTGIYQPQQQLRGWQLNF